MSDNLSQRLADHLVKHDIDLLRLAENDEHEIEVAILALAAELTRLLIRYDPSAVGKGFGQQRLDRVVNGAIAIIRDAYKKMCRVNRISLIDIMRHEQSVFARMVGASLGTTATITMGLVRTDIPVSDLREIIDNRMITANANDAATMREFFEREAASHHRRFTGALRQAFAQDETITQMIKRLDEVTKIQAREAASVIRTGYNHVVNQLRIEMMQRNGHFFRGVIAIAILDGRTSPVCRARSRGMWDLNTGRALPESPVRTSFPGPVPWHYNERTQLYPLTRSIREVGRMGSRQVKHALDELTAEQKRLLSVDPPDDETYTQWLKRQSASVQNDVLGPSRRKLWLDGKLTLQEMVTQKGRPLRLDELKRKAKAA